MWFGTKDGVNRYDGYSFKVFRHDGTPNSLAGVEVRTLFKDQSGVLWISVDEYLDRFDPATESVTHYRHNENDRRNLSGIVFSICQDSAGMLWLATDHGLDKLDPASGRFTHYRHDPDDPNSLYSDNLTFVTQSRKGNLWIVSRTGLDALDPRTDKITHYLDLQRSQIESTLLPDMKVYEDRSGVLWVISISGDGLASFDPITKTFARYSFHQKEQDPGKRAGVSSIIEDKDGSLWLGTVGRGLIKFDAGRKNFIRYQNKPGVPGTLPNNFVFSLFEDREGSIWAGTGGGGVVRFPREPMPFRIYRNEPANPNSLDQNFALSLYQDSEGVLWIGNDSVLNRRDPKTGRYSFYRNSPADPGSISDGSVTSTIEDRFGYLWFGTYGGGLDRFDRKTGRFKHYRNDPANPRSLSSDRVLALLVDHGGTLWVGTGDGLNRFDRRTQQFTIFRQEPSSPISRIVEDEEGIFWISTLTAGLSRFDPETGKFTAYRHRDPDNPGSLSNDRVNTLCLARAGALWIGTQYGLNRFDRQTGVVTASYFQKDGLPSSAVQGIEEDAQGRLWVSTNNGLSRFQPATNRFQNYYESDGLAGNDFGLLLPVSFKSRTGELFFGGVNGVTSFYPEKLREFEPYVPPVVLTDFRLKNDPVPIGRDSRLKKAISHVDSLTLSHDQNIFSLEFSALSYFSPARNRYRYKLEPLENNWNEVDSDRRSATYTTVPPGEYTFRVQGSNSFGMWNEQGASIRIVIMPPWWSTWWFRALAALAVFVAIWGLHRYRLHQMAREFSANLDGRIDERLRVARDLHDTLLQSFQGLLMRFQAARNRLRGRAEDVAQVLDRALDAAELAITEARAAVQDLRSSTVVTNELAKAVEALGEEMAEQQRAANGDATAFSVEVEGTPKELHPMLRDEVYRITGEGLRNAFRHAHARRIEVEILYGPRQLRVRIRDDGVGLDVSVLNQGRAGHWGLAGMRERAKGVGGQLDVWSKHGTGTEVELTVPASVAYGGHVKRRFRAFKALFKSPFKPKTGANS